MNDLYENEAFKKPMNDLYESEAFKKIHHFDYINNRFIVDNFYFDKNCESYKKLKTLDKNMEERIMCDPKIKESINDYNNILHKEYNHEEYYMETYMTYNEREDIVGKVYFDPINNQVMISNGETIYIKEEEKYEKTYVTYDKNTTEKNIYFDQINDFNNIINEINEIVYEALLIPEELDKRKHLSMVDLLRCKIDIYKKMNTIKEKIYYIDEDNICENINNQYNNPKRYYSEKEKLKLISILQIKHIQLKYLDVKDHFNSFEQYISNIKEASNQILQKISNSNESSNEILGKIANSNKSSNQILGISNITKLKIALRTLLLICLIIFILLNQLYNI